MTEHEYFQNLKDLIDSKILQVPTGQADSYLSKNANTARQQLRTSLAFCHFVHRMVCAQGSPVISAKFASVTVKQFPVVLKGVSRPTLSWAQQPLQSDCNHMDFDRNLGCLPLASLAKMV